MDFIPPWVTNLLSVLSVPSILLTITVWLLGRRDANRKLVVDEGTLKKSEFDSFTSAQNVAIQRAEDRAGEAEAKAENAEEHANQLDEAFVQMREAFYKLKGFVRKAFATHNIEMTPEELAEFEATKPPPRPTRVRK